MTLRSGIAPSSAAVGVAENGSTPLGVARRAAAVEQLAEVLDAHTEIGSLWRTEGEKIRCVACGHRCLLAAGRRGVCKVRFNRAGQLHVPFGYVAGVQCDPVEKKPFYHLYPGSDALTFGMLGCDFHCAYCQNWVTSQALRDPASTVALKVVSARQLAEAGRRLGARLVVSSYNEPLITAEWAVAVFAEAKAAGMACVFVSNGNATPEVIAFLHPWLVAYKIDLKGFDARRYRSLGGTLEQVKEAIRLVYQSGLWLEIVTLIVPGFNDSDQELGSLADFIASVSPDIPWHVTASHPDYKLKDSVNTTAAQLMRAAEAGVAAGLRFVYAGNAPGRVGRWENTWCPGCGELLVARNGFVVGQYRLTPAGQCPKCAAAIPGVWPTDPVLPPGSGQGLSPRVPRRVL